MLHKFLSAFAQSSRCLFLIFVFWVFRKLYVDVYLVLKRPLFIF